MNTPTFPPPVFQPFAADGSGYDTDVVVVGLGPAGGTAALALATYGVRVHAVSMFPWVANSPRAHITNQRAVEVLRDLGVEQEVRKYATPCGVPELCSHTLTCGDQVLSSCRHDRGRGAATAVSRLCSARFSRTPALTL